MLEFVVNCACVDMDDHKKDPLFVRIMTYVAGIIMICLCYSLIVIVFMVLMSVFS